MFFRWQKIFENRLYHRGRRSSSTPKIKITDKDDEAILPYNLMLTCFYSKNMVNLCMF